MAKLQIENLPDELYSQIECLASEKNFTLNDAVIHLLTQSLSFEPDKVMINNQPMSAILQRIRNRPRVNPRDFGLTDSTILIQEDRNR
jgi:plasmid stability protein